MRKRDNPTAWMREYMRNRRKANKESGCCVVCGAVANGKTLCEKHMKKQMEYNKRRKEKMNGKELHGAVDSAGAYKAVTA